MKFRRPENYRKDLATFRTTVNYVIVPVTVLDEASTSCRSDVSRFSGLRK